jgi:hypothetical protein
VQNKVFYGYAAMGQDRYGNMIPGKATAIPSTFLVVNGGFVPDPNLPKKPKDQIRVYSRLRANGTIDESSYWPAYNPRNYLVGPMGMTPVERLRYYAAQARAAGEPVPAHMQDHHAVKKLIQAQHSYAPVRGRQSGGAATPGTRAEGGSW